MTNGKTTTTTNGKRFAADELPQTPVFDYRKKVPAWVSEAISTQLAIDSEDARRAGKLGFMAQAMVRASLPYKDPKTESFTRRNGAFTLRIVAGDSDGGLPYGIYPRLLLSWATTEAVRTHSPVLQLGDSLRTFLTEVLDIRSDSGGARGSGRRVLEQMKRLFGAYVTATYAGDNKRRGFKIKGIQIVEEAELDALFIDALEKLDAPQDEPETEMPEGLWTPQSASEAGKWKSYLKLSDSFYKECTTSPVPIDLRAYKALRGSPLAMDIYTWLTYRMSYTEHKTAPIRWETLMMQFGSNYSSSLDQAVRDFKKAFLAGLKKVNTIYTKAKVEVTDTGLVLLPSPTHVPPVPKQRSLSFD
jgi:hypothetical protein